MTVLSRITTSIAAATVTAAVLSGTALQAGSLDDPVIATPVAPVAPLAIDWTGAYGGVTLSYNQGHYGNDGVFPGDGEGELDGYGLGLLLGYNWQRGNIVYGGELAYSATNIEGEEACANPAFACGMEIDQVASIRGRLGVAAGPRSLVYLTAGWAAANAFGYTEGPGGDGETQRLNGYLYGLGFEHAVSDRFNVRAAVLRHEFDESDFQTDIIYNDVGADFTTIEIGMIMRF